MLNFLKFLKWISRAVCFVFLNSTFAQAGSPTEPANGFLVVTKGNLEVASGGSPHIHGGLAIGGQLLLKGGVMDVNMDALGTNTFKDGSESRYIGLIVEGGVAYTAGAVHVHDSRYIKLKNLTSHSKYSSSEKKAVNKDASGWSGPYIQVTTGEQDGTSVNKDVFDFDGAFNEFISHSNTLKGLSQNAAFNTSTKTMQNTNSGVLNVLNVTSDLNSIIAAGEFKFTNTPSATYPVVINVNLGGSTYSWNHPNFPGLPASAASYIIWNFHNGHLTLNSGDKIFGTIFAPQSDIVKNSANDIEGQVIANNLTLKNGQVHVYNYEPPVPTECTGCKSVNLIYNPDFGSCPSQSVEGWEVEKSHSSVSWGTFCHDFEGSIGDKSVGQLNWNDVVGHNYVRQKVEDGVIPGKSFIYTASAATHHNYYNGQTRIGKIWIEFYNSSDQKIGGNVGEQFVTTAYSTFLTYTISGTIPLNAKYLKIVGYANGTALKFTNNLLTIDCYDKINVTPEINHPNCLNQNGKITVNTTGGSGLFRYRIRVKGSGSGGWSNWQDSNVFNRQDGIYEIDVEDKKTTSDNCKKRIEVTLTKAPAPTVQVNSGVVCLGQKFTLTANTTNCTGTITWVAGGIQVGTGTSIEVQPGTTTTYTAKCINSPGCEGSGNGTVTVVTPPTISVNSPTICSGSTATLTVTGCEGGTITWTGGLTGNPATTPALTSNATYEATCTITSGGTSCTSKATATVTVSELPTVILEAGKLTCEIKKVTVVAAATGQGITYKWTVPAGASDPGNYASLETSVPGVYTVEVTTGDGCKASDQIEVIKDEDLPAVTVNDKVIGCDETEVTLTAEGSAGVTYSWTGPGSFTATTKEITVSVAGTYSVTVTSLVSGCKATDNGVVTKLPKPGPPASGPHKVCYGEEITLSATCAAGTAKWYKDAALTQEITVLTFVPEESHIYYAVCATQDCVSEPTQSVVTVTPDFAAPELEADPEEVIKGESSTLSGTCETGTLVWYKDAGLTQVLGAGATLVVTPETTTTYYAACEVDDCKKASEVIVKVKDQIFDLALRKTIKGGGKNPVVYPGASITFEIEVFNQGNVTATNIQVTDYIPLGLTISDANWTEVGGAKATLKTLIASLAPGASVKREITFTVNNDFTGKAVNAAEISSADGGTDIDSTPDDNPGNDGTPIDDEINEDGKNGGDEDDHDIEEITIEETPVFDLALRKTVKAGQKTVFKPGDEVIFNITVFNQGNVDATDIDLVDYIPAGLTLNDANWVLDGSKARWLGAIPSLAAGAEATVSITFTLNNDVTGEVIINTAEISGAKNDKGLDDIDSTPDDTKDNDGTVKNDEINEDGKKGGDEDDHDIEPISVCPDQTCLTAKVNKKK